MNDTNQNKHHTVIQWLSISLQAIAALGIIYASLSLSVAKKGIVDQHEWNRRHYTVTVLKEFNSDVSPYKDLILKNFPGLYDSKQSRSLSKEEVEEIYRVDPKENPDLYEARSAIISYLNYMEFLCTAYKMNVIDQETVYALYNGIFLRNYQFFQSFIELAQQELGSQVFKPIVEVMGHWSQLKANNKFTPMKETGTF